MNTNGRTSDYPLRIAALELESASVRRVLIRPGLLSSSHSNKELMMMINARDKRQLAVHCQDLWLR
jgi:hypothetical protein